MSDKLADPADVVFNNQEIVGKFHLKDNAQFFNCAFDIFVFVRKPSFFKSRCCHPDQCVSGCIFWNVC